MKRAFVILIAAGIVVLAGLTATTDARAGVRLTSVERRVLACVNQERARHGLAAVHAHRALLRAARAHSRSMAHCAFFSHLSPGGATVAERLITYGYAREGCRRWTVGEDIYAGRTGTLYATAEVAVLQWMSSPAHRRVILTARFRDAGVGVHAAGGKRYFTLDLGRRVR